MPILDHRSVDPLELPGLVHRTIAGARQGLRSLEVWRQTIAPGEATPMHKHACEEVVVILSGAGACEIEGWPQPFAAPSSLILEPSVAHRIVNTGREPLELIGVLGMSPVRVETPDGQKIDLPWD